MSPAHAATVGPGSADKPHSELDRAVAAQRDHQKGDARGIAEDSSLECILK
jgi:hypothetical protein